MTPVIKAGETLSLHADMCRLKFLASLPNNELFLPPLGELREVRGYSDWRINMPRDGIQLLAEAAPAVMRR
jgi:hypothetical protein